MNKLLFITLISLMTSNAFAMPNPASKNCVDKDGKLEIAGQITRVWPLAEVEDAMEALRSGQVTRAVLDHTL